MKKNPVGFGIILLILCFNIKPFFAGRPLSTEDAGVSSKGVFSIEMGIDYTSQNNKYKDFSLLFVPIYGVSERIETSIEFPYTFITNEADTGEGLNDINLVIKTLIIPEREYMPTFLLKTQVKLSNGDERKGLGSGDEDIGFAGVLTKQLGAFIVHANLGYTFVGKKERPNSFKNYILYGFAFEYSINEKLKIVGEIYGESDLHSDIGSFQHHILNPLPIK